MQGGEQSRAMYLECCLLKGWQPGRCGWVGRFVSALKFSSPTFSPRVPMVLQVPRAWLVRGASLVSPGSVVREDFLACPAHR